MLWCLCYCSIQASELLKTTAVASRYFGVPGGDEEGMCVCVCVSVCDTVCVCVRERERERERERKRVCKWVCDCVYMLVCE
jgi:hypothetical protein